MHPHHDRPLVHEPTRPRPSGPSAPLRVLLWRWRFPCAALLLGCACAVIVGELRPAPAETSPVLVAARPLTAGHVLGSSDVRLASMPKDLVPSGSSAAAGPLVGAVLAVPVPAGLPLVDGLLVRDLVQGPPGTVVATVRLADAAVSSLLAAGTHVDVLAATEDGTTGRSLARGALVLAPPRGIARETTGSAGGLVASSLGHGSPADAFPPVLLAVAPDEAAALAGAGPAALLSAVIVK